MPPLPAHNNLTRLKSGVRGGWLLKVCGSVAQAREHEGNDSATGMADVRDPQERAMPQPQPHQATRAVRVSVPPLPAHNNLTRLKSGVSGARRKSLTRTFWQNFPPTLWGSSIGPAGIQLQYRSIDQTFFCASSTLVQHVCSLDYSRTYVSNLATPGHLSLSQCLQPAPSTMFRCVQA